MKISKWSVMSALCKASFYEFVKRFWGVLITAEPVWNWHIEFLCKELQRAAERVFQGLPKEYDYIINVPPGTTKSTICSIMFPAWILTRMPHAQIICASHTEKLVFDLSTKCRFVVQSDEYQKCFPYIKLRDDQNTKGYWMTEQGGWRFSATVGGMNPTGFHAHFQIVDDPIDPESANSEPERIAANSFMSSTLSNRKVNAEITVMFLIMQRLHQDDPTGNRLDNPKVGQVRHICLPAELGDNVKPAYLKSKYKDGLLDPKRLTREVLEEKKAYGESFYSGQYRQHPVPSGGGIFKCEAIHLEKFPPRKFKRMVRYWDKAGTKDAGARTAGVKMAEDMEGNIWILHVVKGQWAPHQRETVMLNTAKQDGRETIIGIEQEPGSGGKESAENSARRLKKWRVKLDKPTGDKVVRAEGFAYAVGNGIVHVLIAEWTREYIDELMYFDKGRFKDQVDASSGAFSLLTKPTRFVGAI